MSISGRVQPDWRRPAPPGTGPADRYPVDVSFPGSSFPSIDLTEFDLTELDLSSLGDNPASRVIGAVASDVVDRAKDAAYVSVGLGILTYQRLQVRRQRARRNR